MSGESEALGVMGEFLEPLATAEDSDMANVISAEGYEEHVRRLVAPDATIGFPTPDGGFVGEMAGPFRGPGGYLEGWREWLSSWESFRVTGGELIDVGDGRFLFLADAHGRMRGMSVEVEQKVAALYTIQAGAVVRIDHFLDQNQARAAAGIA
jgi:hypothetical protein